MLNIIHLKNDPLYPHREEREKSFLKEIEEQNIKEYKVWDAIFYEDNPIKAISQSHKMIVRHAKENKLPRVIIAEDDIHFTKSGAWEFFLNSIPSDCDMFLGHIYHGKFDEFGKINGSFSSMGLYCVNEKFYDYFLSVTERKHIDLIMNRAMRYDIRVCLPMVCRQADGWSDNSKCHLEHSNKEIGKPMF